MRVLHVIPQMGIGGAERTALSTIAASKEAGHEVSLAAAPGPLDADEALVGIERVRLRERGRSASSLLESAAQVARLVHRFRPDVVHTHGTRALVVSSPGVRLAFRGRPATVVTCHGVVADEYAASARLFRLADATVAISGEMARTLLDAGLPPSRLRVIPNGVTAAVPPVPGLREIMGPPAAAIVIAVGRLVPEKAHDRLIRAAHLLAGSDPPVRFLLVGDGPLRGSLEDLRTSLGVEGMVQLLGARNDARALIAASDIVAFSSKSEGLSVVALEAMAAGVPIVSTPAPGMTELLAAGAGLVVPRDRPEDLAAGIRSLLLDAERRRQMGEVGRSLTAERYSASAMAGSYLELYAAVRRR